MADILESAVDFHSSSVAWEFERSVEKENSNIFFSVMVELTIGISHILKSSIHRFSADKELLMKN